MTREEAIAELSVLHERLSNPKDCEDGCYSWEDGWYVEAIDMAIKALQAEPVKHGEWIEMGENKDGTHSISCSECKRKYKTRGHARSWNVKDKYRWCPNCGARMTPYKGGDLE